MHKIEEPVDPNQEALEPSACVDVRGEPELRLRQSIVLLADQLTRRLALKR